MDNNTIYVVWDPEKFFCGLYRTEEIARTNIALLVADTGENADDYEIEPYEVIEE